MRDFAQELVEKVVDHRYADMSSVKTCGFVCKRWLFRSRFHLFSRIILDANNLALFTSIVDSSPSPILVFFRHLTLRFIRRSLDDGLLAKTPHCHPIFGVSKFVSLGMSSAILKSTSSIGLSRSSPVLGHYPL
ncbi:hypothetical protein B0H13DRAFT_1631617 [Mycena leptocephala]|nr:hypothetical protein B0H13DRAFT_1631617 [Mycena leptocephala]